MAIQARKPDGHPENRTAQHGPGDAPAGFIRLGRPANDNRAALAQILRHPGIWAAAAAVASLIAALA